MFKSLHRNKLSFLVGKYLGVERPLYINFFSKISDRAEYENSSCSSSPTPGMTNLFNFSLSDMYVFHCGFNLHFSND